jgi:hypothetical protein
MVQLYQGSVPDATINLWRNTRPLMVAAWLESLPMKTLEQTYA